MKPAAQRHFDLQVTVPVLSHPHYIRYISSFADAQNMLSRAIPGIDVRLAVLSQLFLLICVHAHNVNPWRPGGEPFPHEPHAGRGRIVDVCLAKIQME